MVALKTYHYCNGKQSSEKQSSEKQSSDPRPQSNLQHQLVPFVQVVQLNQFSIDKETFFVHVIDIMRLELYSSISDRLYRD
jgi:hypothetical protein